MDYAFWGQFFMGDLNTQDLLEARNAALADQIARNQFLPNARLKYAGMAGVGRHGGALLFNEADDSGRPFRKIVVKYSLNSETDDDLRNEAKYLEILKGAEHIAQIIPLAETDLNIAARGKRPTIALEYIPNGTIRRFRARFNDYHAEMHRRGIPIYMPSRILWRMMFCFARQIAAMAWPPRNENPDAVNEREGLFQDSPKMTITQNSPHLDNFIIGDLTAGDDEHGLVPIIKMIDFGRGKMETTYGEAIWSNMWGAANMIVALAVPFLDERILIRRGEGNRDWNTHMLPLNYNPGGIIQTDAPPEFLKVDFIDPRLRHLVARCLCPDPRYNPTLEDLLAECEAGVRRTAKDFGFGPRTYLAELESDASIEATIRAIVFDADSVVPSYDTAGGSGGGGGGFEPEPMLARQLGTTLLGLACHPPRPGSEEERRQAAEREEAGRREREADAAPLTLAQRIYRIARRAAARRRRGDARRRSQGDARRRSQDDGVD
ncbi:hypothetical protein Hte_004453 [Hypoxylon texense]